MELLTSISSTDTKRTDVDVDDDITNKDESNIMNLSALPNLSHDYIASQVNGGINKINGSGETDPISDDLA